MKTHDFKQLEAFIYPSDTNKDTLFSDIISLNGGHEAVYTEAHHNISVRYIPYLSHHKNKHLSIEWINPEKEFGLIATEDLEAGDFIGVFYGRFRRFQDVILEDYTCGSTNHYILSLITHFEFSKAEDAITYQQSWVIDAKNEGGIVRYINHSSNPNCEVVLIWIEDHPYPIMKVNEDTGIKKGEELTFDYGGSFGEHLNIVGC